MKLERLLRIRQWQEEASQQELARCQRALFQEQERLGQLQEERLALSAWHGQITGDGACDVSALQLFNRFRQVLENDIVLQKRSTEQQQQVLDRQRRAWEECRRDKEKVEKIMQRRREALQVEEKRKDTRAMDEIARRPGGKAGVPSGTGERL